jgi:hypothetical protein
MQRNNLILQVFLSIVNHIRRLDAMYWLVTLNSRGQSIRKVMCLYNLSSWYVRIIRRLCFWQCTGFHVWDKRLEMFFCCATLASENMSRGISKVLRYFGKHSSCHIRGECCWGWVWKLVHSLILHSKFHVKLIILKTAAAIFAVTLHISQLRAADFWRHCFHFNSIGECHRARMASYCCHCL